MANVPKSAIEPERIALATCVLLAAERQDRASGTEPRSVEEVLGAVGFGPGEVHALLGGNYNTVKTRVRRARTT